MTDHPGPGYPQSPNPGDPPPWAGGQPPWAGQQPPSQQPPGHQPYGRPEQAGYGQQPYGQPPGGYPPAPGGPGFAPYGPPPRRGKLPWILGGAAVAVAAAVVVVVAAMGGSDSRTAPAAALDTFIQAARHDDAKTARAVTCQPLSGQIDENGEKSNITSYKIGRTHESGDSATVDLTVTVTGGERDDLVARLQKRDGGWKVCEVSLSRHRSSGGAFAPTDLPTGPAPDETCWVTPQDSTPISIPNGPRRGGVAV
jgi:hypothetical protein